jgi:hypothetical protein
MRVAIALTAAIMAAVGVAPPVSDAARLTPVTLAALAPPQPVLGMDGRRHLAYELLVTNVLGTPLQLTGLEVLDASTRRPIATIGGDRLMADATGITAPLMGDPRLVGANQTAVVWLDVVLPGSARVPVALLHRITVAGAPSDFAARTTGGRVRVDQRSPRTMQSPVAGAGWVADEGCCSAPTHHRRGLLPVNGRLAVSQRFAIDWSLLAPGHRGYVGDPAQVTNYPSYGKPIRAPADGRVVTAVDGLPNQQPPEPPRPPVPFSQLTGNHVVLSLGGGVYAMLAHMKPHSVRVHRGQRVRAGQLLGLVGNSGNSTTPHVHFQLQDGPDPLSSDGLPFVLASADLRGRITTPYSDETLGLLPPDLGFQASPRPGVRHARMPLNLQVFDLR